MKKSNKKKFKSKKVKKKGGAESSAVKQIYIIGDSHHSETEHHKKLLTKEFLVNGFFVLGEGVKEVPGENIEDLDDETAVFRTDILFASLAVNSAIDDDTHILLKKGNMFASMLKTPMPPPAKMSEMIFFRDQYAAEKKINQDMLDFFKRYPFDFNYIYQHYFPEDEYKEAMTTLLNLNMLDATMVYTTKSEGYYREAFIKITREAREDYMIERIRKRASTHRVAVFTGQAHVKKLTKDLSKDYAVKNYTLPSPEFKKMRKEIIDNITRVDPEADAIAQEMAAQLILEEDVTSSKKKKKTKKKKKGKNRVDHIPDDVTNLIPNNPPSTDEVPHAIPNNPLSTDDGPHAITNIKPLTYDETVESQLQEYREHISRLENEVSELREGKRKQDIQTLQELNQFEDSVRELESCIQKGPWALDELNYRNNMHKLIMGMHQKLEEAKSRVNMRERRERLGAASRSSLKVSATNAPAAASE